MMPTTKTDSIPHHHHQRQRRICVRRRQDHNSEGGVEVGDKPVAPGNPASLPP
eukprot:CAMPEP_0119569906 /NCGR_PEP_ID=MMETSP1352-20130426/42984_1 /TAXON_ID=265584 /ORGANISM="Stauroneis constricta, Strain CCMP1120" /LENGTH=52 /DNA_ID=CAMNT_0007619541 /DNA_START=135 /DNA_END=290 /DNA_ORIENTATION=-